LDSEVELAVTRTVAGVLAAPPWTVVLIQEGASVVTLIGSAVLPLAVI